MSLSDEFFDEPPELEPPEWAEPIPISAHRTMDAPEVAQPPAEQVTRYEIRDATGAHIATHVRHDYRGRPKTFTWQLPDGTYGLGGIATSDLPLYGAHKLGDWHGLIVIVEGEKKADALCAVGIPALGTVTGSSGTPGALALGELSGRLVYLWPDNDAVGRRHMERVSAGLRGGAASVRWVEPPADRPAGWDAADALAEPGGRELVQSLIEAAMTGPEFQPAQPVDRRPESKPLIFRTAAEIAELVPEARSWPCIPWLASGAITELSGKVKVSGKTTFVFAMVNAIVRGQPFLGQPTIQSPVVILSEQPLASLRVALARAGLLDRTDVEVLTWTETSGTPWKEVAEAAVARCHALGGGVLVVDTLPQFAGLRGDSENDSGAAMEAIAPIQAAAAAGLAVLVDRHDRKGGGEVGESARGSSAFAGAVDIVLRLSRPDGNQRLTIRKIDALSRFDETPRETLIELTPDGYVALGSVAAVAFEEARERIIQALSSAWEKPPTEADLIGKPEPSRSTVQRVLKDLTAAKLVERSGTGRRGSPYRWQLIGSLSALPTDEVRAETLWEDPADPPGAGHVVSAMVRTPAIHSAQTLTLSRAEGIETVDEELAERATDDDAELWP
jgi:hypothetical protein